jgi:hypothetical protein
LAESKDMKNDRPLNLTQPIESKDTNVCPACLESESRAGLLHCCRTTICVTCVMTLVFKANPSICPFCKQDPKKAVMGVVVLERQVNPNEVRLRSSIITRTNGICIPITSGTVKGSVIMAQISAVAGFDLMRRDPGTKMVYKLIYRDRYLDLSKTLFENGWSTGVATMDLVESRTYSSNER